MPRSSKEWLEYLVKSLFAVLLTLIGTWAMWASNTILKHETTISYIHEQMVLTNQKLDLIEKKLDSMDRRLDDKHDKDHAAK